MRFYTWLLFGTSFIGKDTALDDYRCYRGEKEANVAVLGLLNVDTKTLTC